MKQLKFISCLLIAAVLLSVSACKSESAKSAKYVFYFIGDGMGFSHVALSEAYLSAKEGKVGSTALEFSSFPVMGMATTYSASNFITCSSAAGTALSTGTKTNNGMLGVAPDSSELRSIAYDSFPNLASSFSAAADSRDSRRWVTENLHTNWLQRTVIL